MKTREIEEHRKWWIKRVQLEEEITEEEKVQLNLQLDKDGILECRGRIECDYPIFLPRNNTFTRKTVEQAHLATLHGGVATTMGRLENDIGYQNFDSW